MCRLTSDGQYFQNVDSIYVDVKIFKFSIFSIFMLMATNMPDEKGWAWRMAPGPAKGLGNLNLIYFD